MTVRSIRSSTLVYTTCLLDTSVIFHSFVLEEEALSTCCLNLLVFALSRGTRQPINQGDIVLSSDNSLLEQADPMFLLSSSASACDH